MSVINIIALCILSVAVLTLAEYDQENTPVPAAAGDVASYEGPAGNIRARRKAVRDTRRRWLNKTIPYRIHISDFTWNELYYLRRAMTEWERYTCLKFKIATNDDRNSIKFQNGVGCNSQLGMVGGVQGINLETPGCRFKGLYIHEIGHAIGLNHEHQLPDRDDYVIINFKNVNPEMRDAFDLIDASEVNNFSIPYDLSSIMHYETNAFGINDNAQTITVRNKSLENTVGRVYLKELAYSDVWIVNLMYNCASHCPNKNKCGRDGHLDQNCNCICKDGSSDCDTTKTTPEDASCKNIENSWKCYNWANQGECENNPGYMTQNCAKACGTCGTQPTTTTCSDVYPTKCPMWKQRGDCLVNKRWMKINCKATCNQCGNNANRPEVNCQNKHRDNAQCEEWAKQGECAANPMWVPDNCKKSCEACTENIYNIDDRGDINIDTMACQDYHQECAAWADAGDCSTNDKWMLANCRKKCNRCDNGQCQNLFSDSECGEWAGRGECQANPKWMAQNCAAACKAGVCRGGATNPPTRVTSSPNCVDNNASCASWAAHNHCNSNPGYMLVNCKKSCRVC